MILTAQFKQSMMQSIILNGDQRLQDAKDKAIQSINQALANKLKEIESFKCDGSRQAYCEK